MKLPAELVKMQQWCLIGPMGPDLPTSLSPYPLMAVDGGARFCSEAQVWVGDGDSLDGPMKAEHVFRYPPKKSLSDLALALSFFEMNEPLTLHLWGFLGGRRDHELLNFGEVMRFLEGRSSSEIIFYDPVSQNKTIRCLSQGGWNLSHHGLFSLASFRSIKIKIQGNCEYTLNEATELITLSTLGLSNSASGDFSLSANGPMMIIFPETT